MRKWTKLLAVLAVLALIAAACSNEPAEETTTTAAETTTTAVVEYRNMLSTLSAVNCESAAIRLSISCSATSREALVRLIADLSAFNCSISSKTFKTASLYLATLVLMSRPCCDTSGVEAVIVCRRRSRSSIASKTRNFESSEATSCALRSNSAYSLPIMRKLSL